MAEYPVKRPLKRPPKHPGAILRQDVLPALGLSVAEAARRLGVSRQQLHRVLAETHPISTEMALRIARLEGNTPNLWLRMQQAYDLWQVEQRLKDELTKIEPVAITSHPLSRRSELAREGNDHPLAGVFASKFAPTGALK